MPDSLIYIAIDFGTAYSGYCLKSNTLSYGGHFRNVEWGAEFGIRTCKTPTCILFDEDGNFQDFGYAAMKKYLRPGKRNDFFFSDFKMELYKNKDVNSESELTAHDGKKMAALTVFTESLRYLKDHAISKIQNVSNSIQLQDTDFTWVLTVPAIWSNVAKDFMRNAAIQAGLVKETEPDRLILALESEAASVYCKQLPSDGFIGGEQANQRLDQNSGTQYIVADCGGGTIDITVHEVLAGGVLKEVHKASGNDLGGQNIDRQLKSFLREILGDCWEKYEENHASELQKIMYEFASAKCAEKSYAFNVPCSYNLIETIKAEKGEDVHIASMLQGIHGARWNNGSIEISPSKFRSFFDESLRGIAKMIKEILAMPQLHIDYLLLVGGYASCTFLQDYIKGQFGRKCKVLCPLLPQEAVMVGAVDFGMRPEIVKSRICPLTYGIGLSEKFDNLKHKADKMFWTSDGEAYCSDVFARLVVKDESLGFNERRSYTYSPIANDQTSMCLKFFSTTRRNAKYVDEWGIEEIGSMTVSMPDTRGGKNRQVKLNVSFGFTEIKATVTDLTSLNTQTISIDFMRK